MRHFAAPTWMVVAASALASYFIVLAAFLLAVAGRGYYGQGFADLNLFVAQLVGLFLGIPTLLLAALMFVRRIARVIAIAATLWLTLNAYIWLPTQSWLAWWAGIAALVVLGAMLMDWRANWVASAKRVDRRRR